MVTKYARTVYNVVLNLLYTNLMLVITNKVSSPKEGLQEISFSGNQITSSHIADVKLPRYWLAKYRTSR